MSHQSLKAPLTMYSAHPEPEVAIIGRIKRSRTFDQSVFLRKWDHFRFSSLAGLRELR
jgi:hypothetical protein